MSEQNKMGLNTFFGVKAGMTRVFNEDGNHVPVTVIKLVPNYISQVKTQDKDGYEAYQVAYFEKRAKLINRPIKGHLSSASIKSFFSRFAEVSKTGANEEDLGKQLSYDSFKPQEFVI